MDADVFEPVDLYIARFTEISHTIAVILIKIRLLTDLRSLQNSTIVGERLPQELLDNTRGHLVSTIVAKNKAIMDRQDQSTHIKKLEDQVDQLYKAVKRENEHFWPALLNPGRNLTTRPDYYGRGDINEMKIKLQHCYDAWAETPGAIDVIREKVKAKT